MLYPSVTEYSIFKKLASFSTCVVVGACASNGGSYMYPSVSKYTFFKFISNFETNLRKSPEDMRIHICSTMNVWRSSRDLFCHPPQPLSVNTFSRCSHIHKHSLSPSYPFFFSPRPVLAFSSLFHCPYLCLSPALLLSLHFCFFSDLSLFLSTFFISSDGLLHPSLQ